MAERVLMKGNEAIAEAAIRAGCRHYFGYPITPQTEIAAYMAKRMPKIGGVFLQAESEIASINMVYGASAAGMRVMTSSSSPGISLKGEGLSYIAGSDVPAFVVNVQRGGPGLGGIQPSQSDYFQATRGGGLGDYHMIVLAPASVQEMASLTVKGFNLADKYNMIAMILADGTIGQMMEPISFEDVEVEHYDKPWALTGTECKRKHNIVNSLYLQPDVLERKNFERYEKYKAVEASEAMAETFMMDDAEVGVVAFGIAARVAKNAVVAERCGGRPCRGHQGRPHSAHHPLALPQGCPQRRRRPGEELCVRGAEHGPDDRGHPAGHPVPPPREPLQPGGRYDPQP